MHIVHSFPAVLYQPTATCTLTRHSVSMAVFIETFILC